MNDIPKEESIIKAPEGFADDVVKALRDMNLQQDGSTKSYEVAGGAVLGVERVEDPVAYSNVDIEYAYSLTVAAIKSNQLDKLFNNGEIIVGSRSEDSGPFTTVFKLKVYKSDFLPEDCVAIDAEVNSFFILIARKILIGESMFDKKSTDKMILLPNGAKVTIEQIKTIPGDKSRSDIIYLDDDGEFERPTGILARLAEQESSGRGSIYFTIICTEKHACQAVKISLEKPVKQEDMVQMTRDNAKEAFGA